MKNQYLSSALTLLFLFLFACGFSQDLDLIVTTKGDSIACRIDSITGMHIHYQMISHDSWIHTKIPKSNVSEYKQDVIDKRLYNFKSGTSIITSIKPTLPASIREIQRNSVYVGILSINYARMIPGDRVGVTIAGGLSFVTTLDGNAIGLMAETTLLTGGTQHFFEPGLLLYFDTDVVWPMIRTGYRYQGPEGFLFRAAPLFGYLDGFSVLPAISIGYSF